MEMKADTDAMFELGRKYQKAGLSLTPKDCQPVDKFIFGEIRGLDRADQAKTYNALRGAFNRGWAVEDAAAKFA